MMLYGALPVSVLLLGLVLMAQMAPMMTAILHFFKIMDEII